MAFLDETGLAELWSLVKAEDAEVLAAGPKVVCGSYTATGAYGKNNPNTLTFDFVPKCVIMLGSWSGTTVPSSSGDVEYNGRWIVFPETMPTEYTQHYGFAQYTYRTQTYGKRSADAKTIYWYNLSAPEGQLNYSNYKYYYLAIG